MLGDEYDFVLVPRSQLQEYMRKPLCNQALEHLEAAR